MSILPNFVLDRQASHLILEAARWISEKLGDSCDDIFRYLETQPDLLKKLVTDTDYELNWMQDRNIGRLKSDLRGLMGEWEELVKGE